MNKIIISNEVNPYFNLALEEDLLRQAEDCTILYLWQNERTVVIGNNQNPYLECNLKEMGKRDVLLARRLSGGGCVFHDLGNLNFTILMPVDKADQDKEMQLILKTLKQFDLDVILTGRNDIEVEEYKVSGHAFYQTDKAYYHHGTLMVNVNLSMLSDILTPSKLKINSKGINSIRKRVKNLTEFNKIITIPILKSALEKTFIKMYGPADVMEVSEQNLLVTQKEYYQSKEWLFSQSPEFDVLIERKYAKGLFQLTLNMKQNVIVEAHFFTDSLERIHKPVIENYFIGMQFQEEMIWKELEKILGL
ncbi:MAG: lipoyltransferase and lipoate-ligase family protein [Lachnospiraceae bacterium]|jgi:lipoate-protein ligase A|nr:lipoyltransferase and lipoate-ligase family protein [Lachnospiraceae bacterium]